MGELLSDRTHCFHRASYWDPGEGRTPYLVIGLNVPHQDGQVLNAKVHIVVDMLIDALVGRPGISGEETGE